MDDLATNIAFGQAAYELKRQLDAERAAHEATKSKYEKWANPEAVAMWNRTRESLEAELAATRKRLREAEDVLHVVTALVEEDRPEWCDCCGSLGDLGHGHMHACPVPSAVAYFAAHPEPVPQ